MEQGEGADEKQTRRPGKGCNGRERELASIGCTRLDVM